LTLSPGYKVHWHFDNHESFESEYIRFHVPIITNPRAIVRVASEVLHMKKGVVCTCDFGFPHSLRNDGDESRTHLVFDVKKKGLPAEIAEMFDLYAVANKKAKDNCQFLYKNLFNKAFQIKFYCRVLRRKIKNIFFK
jgi:aspartyl/asparaginyl beta-hydroxylase (cupin superfamily)